MAVEEVCPPSKTQEGGSKTREKADVLFLKTNVMPFALLFASLGQTSTKPRSCNQRPSYKEDVMNLCRQNHVKILPSSTAKSKQ